MSFKCKSTATHVSDGIILRRVDVETEHVYPRVLVARVDDLTDNHFFRTSAGARGEYVVVEMPTVSRIMKHGEAWCSMRADVYGTLEDALTDAGENFFRQNGRWVTFSVSTTEAWNLVSRIVAEVE